jgi:hypothetical protein
VPYELLPRQIARKQRRIRIERAAMKIAKTGCPTRAACRGVGLSGDKAEREVRRLCDTRGIPRRHWWGLPHRNWKTETLHPVIVSSPARQRAACARRRKLKQCARSRNPAAKMVEVRR